MSSTESHGGSPADPQQPPGLTDEEEARATCAARLFDIRRLIGALFVLYGVVLTVVGVVGSSAVKHKAAGINIDLWGGIGMLVFGALMVFWAVARPVLPEPPETRGQGSGRIRRAPAR
jgi:hypothetical protein